MIAFCAIKTEQKKKMYGLMADTLYELLCNFKIKGHPSGSLDLEI